jgi:hypothetical protein
MEKLPEMYRDYQWIADRFAKIDGIDMILLNTKDKGKELNLMMTNNKTGKALKTFSFPLKTTFYLDYTAAPANCPNDWDINEFENPEMIIKLALSKASFIFENKSLH